MLRYVPVVALLLLLVVLPVRAQQQQGNVELQFTGSFQSTIGSDEVSATTALALAKVGYFISDRLQLGGYPGLKFERIGKQTPHGTEVLTESTDVGLGLFATYSFLSANATTVPYLGVQYYHSDVFDGAVDDSWAGVNGGLKVFVNRYTALDLGGNLLFALDGGDQQLLLLQVGLSFLL